MKNFISDNTGILIRIDDIAENMNWDLMEKCEVLFDKYNIKPVLGVIPNNQDKELMSYPKRGNFWDKVRQWKNKGWEISMHGYSHLYDQTTNKKDYFGHGGNSEFFGHKLEIQKDKIEKGLEKFNNEKIKIRSFYAPNHTYDVNTLKALKECKINNIIDGYGLMPYSKEGLQFFPQLFHKIILLPFGIQCTQIHLNYWKENEFNSFENFIEKNNKKVITFEDAILKINNSIFYKLLNFLLEKILKFIRIFK
tara:strand:- start:1380 stop:2132 length:753 start_codon:yes stop_codon:yes gene_type:complete